MSTYYLAPCESKAQLLGFLRQRYDQEVRSIRLLLRQLHASFLGACSGHLAVLSELVGKRPAANWEILVRIQSRAPHSSTTSASESRTCVLLDRDLRFSDAGMTARLSTPCRIGSRSGPILSVGLNRDAVFLILEGANGRTFLL